MALIVIALCGFLLLALAGTKAGRMIFKIAGVLIGGAVAVVAVTAWINSHRPDASTVASTSQPDAACHDAKMPAGPESLSRADRELYAAFASNCSDAGQR